MTTPVYVVSLPQQARRRQLMALQLAALPKSFRVELVDAVDGMMLSENARSEDYEPAHSLKVAGRELTQRELGCAMSHRQIYRYMVERNEPIGVVLEDDAGVARWFPEIVEALIEHLDHNESRVVLLTGSFVPSLWKSPLWGNYKIARTQWAQSAFGYVVTQAAARALVSAQSPIRWAADWWAEIEGLGILETRGVLPPCVFPCLLDRDTSIGGGRGSMRTPFMTRARRKLHQLWFRATSWSP
jgi:glycosyl transferase family 25